MPTPRNPRQIRPPTEAELRHASRTAAQAIDRLRQENDRLHELLEIALQRGICMSENESQESYRDFIRSVEEALRGS